MYYLLQALRVVAWDGYCMENRNAGHNSFNICWPSGRAVTDRLKTFPQGSNSSLLSYKATLRLVRSELIARSDVEVRWLGVTHPCSRTSMNLVGQLLNGHRAPIGTSWHACFSKRGQRASSSSGLEQLQLGGETSRTIKESEACPCHTSFCAGQEPAWMVGQTEGSPVLHNPRRDIMKVWKRQVVGKPGNSQT